MRKKSILLFSILGGICGLGIAGFSFGMQIDAVQDHISFVYAQNQDIQYRYDALGRVWKVIYPSGVVITYTYDTNGNLLFCEKTVENGSSSTTEKEKDPSASSTEPAGKPSTESAGNASAESDGKPSTESVGKPSTEDSSGTSANQENGSTNSSATGQAGGTVPNVLTMNRNAKLSAKDIKQYNQFKKKRLTVKSLKSIKTKKKYYLRIQIRQLKKRGIYGETGYQIRYATNSKFKKAKKLRIKRSKSGVVTTKKWKVKKGKTYYVKVRAFLITKKGKVIYSRYSKVKKIKV